MVLTSFILMASLLAATPDISEEDCKKLSDVPQTKPALADLEIAKKDLLELKTLNNEKVFQSLKPEFWASFEELFKRDPEKVSKLEQFYGLLWLIGRHKDLAARRIDFNPDDVRRLLFSTKVFSTKDVPNAIVAVTLFWSKAFNKATYLVKFNEKELRVPLNQGRGFATYKEGLCQIARELIFYGEFEFDVEMTRKKHFYVSNFKNFDLFGTFGSRGTVDVDINYVSVKSVEFLKGSPFGIVRAKVSRIEFDKNEHSILLRMVTNFVTDKSTQPIDW